MQIISAAVGAIRKKRVPVRLFLLFGIATTIAADAHAGRRRAINLGPKVACLGNSNTNLPQLEPADQWCAKLRWVHGFRTRNFAIGGATALPNDLESIFGPLDTGWYGQTQLDAAIAWGPDYIVFAYITNDVQFSGTSLLFGAIAPEETADVLVALVAAAETAGSSALVLSGPPVFDPGPVEWNTEIETINAQLRGLMPDVLLEDTIDFNVDDMLPGGLHLNPVGHSKRAQRVAEALNSRSP